MLLTLEECKTFLKIDWDDEDAQLNLFIQISEDYLKDSVDNFDTKLANERFKNKAKLLIMVLVNEMYSNREMITDKQEKYKYIVQSFLVQMQYYVYG